jgi:hypothetical protein
VRLVPRKLGLGLLVAIVAVALAAPAGASATVTRDGWGLGIADDSYHTPGARIPDEFRAMGAKTLRIQIYWDAAVCDPSEIDRARSWIAQARALGAVQVAVSFKKQPDRDPVCGASQACGAPPTAACYGQKIDPVVRALANEVDFWGPANEPNSGDRWLPYAMGGVNGNGPARLAEYWQQLKWIATILDPTAKLLSPDFHDGTSSNDLRLYLSAYQFAGGELGDFVAWHPYNDLQQQTNVRTNYLVNYISGKPIWITEVGALIRDRFGTPINDEAGQNARIHWMLNDPSGLAYNPAVARISYYHLQAPSGGGWDSALSRSNGIPRRAWSTWCAAANGGNAFQPDTNSPACQDGADAIAVNTGGVMIVRRSSGGADPGFLSNQAWTDIPFYGDRATEFADVDGDRRADAIAVNTGGIVVRRSTATSFAANEVWSGSYYGDRGTHFADVTGDGRADAIAVNNGGVLVVRRSTGGGFSGNEFWTDIPFYGDRATRFADVTGDGRADAIAVNTGGIVVRRSTGSGFSGNELWSGSYYGNQDEGTYFADVTGDGRADAIAVNNGGVLVVRRSTGGGFSGNEFWTDIPFYGDRATRFADVTGDGRADAIGVNNAGIVIRRSTGGGFTANETWTTGSYYGDRDTYFADVTRSTP